MRVLAKSMNDRRRRETRILCDCGTTSGIYDSVTECVCNCGRVYENLGPNGWAMKIKEFKEGDRVLHCSGMTGIVAPDKDRHPNRDADNGPTVPWRQDGRGTVFQSVPKNLTVIPDQFARCRWQDVGRFKSEQCGYTGAATKCDGSFERCRHLGNHDRFGGYPGMLEIPKYKKTQAIIKMATSKFIEALKKTGGEVEKFTEEVKRATWRPKVGEWVWYEGNGSPVFIEMEDHFEEQEPLNDLHRSPSRHWDYLAGNDGFHFRLDLRNIRPLRLEEVSSVEMAEQFFGRKALCLAEGPYQGMEGIIQSWCDAAPKHDGKLRPWGVKFPLSFKTIWCRSDKLTLLPERASDALPESDSTNLYVADTGNDRIVPVKRSDLHECVLPPHRSKDGVLGVKIPKESISERRRMWKEIFNDYVHGTGIVFEEDQELKIEESPDELSISYTEGESTKHILITKKELREAPSVKDLLLKCLGLEIEIGEEATYKDADRAEYEMWRETEALSKEDKSRLNYEWWTRVTSDQPSNSNVKSLLGNVESTCGSPEPKKTKIPEAFPEGIYRRVEGCSACGEDHAGVGFNKHGENDYRGICPKTGAVLGMQFNEHPTAKESRTTFLISTPEVESFGITRPAQAEREKQHRIRREGIMEKKPGRYWFRCPHIFLLKDKTGKLVPGNKFKLCKHVFEAHLGEAWMDRPLCPKCRGKVDEDDIVEAPVSRLRRAAGWAKKKARACVTRPASLAYRAGAWPFRFWFGADEEEIGRVDSIEFNGEMDPYIETGTGPIAVSPAMNFKVGDEFVLSIDQPCRAKRLACWVSRKALYLPWKAWRATRWTALSLLWCASAATPVRFAKWLAWEACKFWAFLLILGLSVGAAVSATIYALRLAGAL